MLSQERGVALSESAAELLREAGDYAIQAAKDFYCRNLKHLAELLRVMMDFSLN